MYPKGDLRKKDDRQLIILISKTNSGHIMKRMHSHAHYEIINVQSSDSNNQIFETDSNQYNFSNNTFMLIPPNTKHQLIRERQNSTRLLINFTDTLASSIFDFLDININKFFENNIIEFTAEQTQALYHIASEATNPTYTSASEEIMLRKGKTILARFIENMYFFKGKPVKELSTLKKADLLIDYIESNYNENLSLDFLSEKFFISKYQICRDVKRKTGKSFTDFLTNLRLSEACNLLSNTNMSITEIAYTVGFNSPSYFSVMFKSYTNLSPTQYRDNKRH